MEAILKEQKFEMGLVRLSYFIKLQNLMYTHFIPG
jgi:hypothetical protein